jgi:hypothetical protein
MVTWTGNETIQRTTFNELIKVSGIVLNQHSNGTYRDATATGTFDGSVLPGVLGFGTGAFGFANQSQIVLCRDNSC